MAKVLARDVHLTIGRNQRVILKAGEAVPAKYKDLVTNPKAFVDAEPTPAVAQAPAAPKESLVTKAAPATTEEVTPADYGKQNKTVLAGLAFDRGLPNTGTKPELVELLIADDAKKAEEAEASTAEAATSDEESGDTVDLGTLDEPALRALAGERGVDITDATSVEEIIAYLESAAEGQ